MLPRCSSADGAGRASQRHVHQTDAGDASRDGGGRRRRRRLGRRPDRERAAGTVRCIVRQGSRAVRAERIDGERSRDQSADEPGRGGHRRSVGARDRSRSRCAGDNQPGHRARAAGSPWGIRPRRAGRCDPPPEPLLHTHVARVPREHAPRQRGSGGSDRSVPRYGEGRARPRRSRAPGRRAHLQRQRCKRGTRA